MLREISRSRARDFAIVGPTFRLLDKKVVPEMMRALKGIGRLVRGRQVIEIDARGAKLLGRSEPMRIWLGCAERPDSLESATYGALWFDEPGQAPEASHHVASRAGGGASRRGLRPGELFLELHGDRLGRRHPDADAS
jgi:hypothetical protein